MYGDRHRRQLAPMEPSLFEASLCFLVGVPRDPSAAGVTRNTRQNANKQGVLDEVLTSCRRSIFDTR